MVKNINGDVYSDLITSYDTRAMAAGYFARKPIDRIVIHHNATTNKNVAINTWLANGAAQTSAHYEVADNEIIGTVGEQTAAWHSGNGAMNARSIGIEHKNATGAPTWTISDATYASSAKLIADICKRYGFKPDATHVIPHSQVHATACPGGINMNKLRSMAMAIYNGGKVNSAPSKPASSSKPATSSNYGLKVGAHVQPRWKKSEAGRVWQLDAVSKVNGIWQGAEYLESGSGFTWTDNGIPLSLVDLTDKNGKKLANQSNAGKGSYFKYNTYFKIKKQGTNPKNGSMSYIVPDGKSDDMGFWVVTKYLQ